MQLQVERRTGKVRRSKTDVPPLYHATTSHAVAALISVSAVLSQTPANTASPRIRGYSPSRGVPVCFPACACPRRDGQAELTWVAGYTPRWFTRLQTFTHPGTNRAGRSATRDQRVTTKPNRPNTTYKCTRHKTNTTSALRRRDPDITPPPWTQPFDTYYTSLFS